MIDLHCHILPGLDDGAKTMPEALEMARIAVLDGQTDVVATPHSYNGLDDNPPDKVLERVERFQANLEKEGIPLCIHPGSEVHIHYEMLQHLQKGEVLTIGNRGHYVLVELPTLQLPAYTESLLAELKAAGCTPLIAHPERNPTIRMEPSLLAKWIENGAIAQLTAGALVGQWGKKLQVFSKYLVQNHLVHVIASDAHNLTKRKPNLQSAMKIVADCSGEEGPQTFLANAQAVLLDGPLTVKDPFATAKRRRFSWF